MIQRDWSRKSINRQIVRVRSVFRWGVAEGLVAAELIAALQALPGLREGERDVRESEPIRALNDGEIKPVIAAATPIVADMIRVQLHTGMRPGEVFTCL